MTPYLDLGLTFSAGMLLGCIIGYFLARPDPTPDTFQIGSITATRVRDDDPGARQPLHDAALIAHEQRMRHLPRTDER